MGLLHYASSFERKFHTLPLTAHAHSAGANRYLSVVAFVQMRRTPGRACVPGQVTNRCRSCEYNVPRLSSLLVLDAYCVGLLGLPFDVHCYLCNVMLV